jgi:hypothetical protein
MRRNIISQCSHGVRVNAGDDMQVVIDEDHDHENGRPGYGLLVP